MRHTKRMRGSTVMAGALIGIGIYLFVGCIPLPGNFKPQNGVPRRPWPLSLSIW